ncbi:hypothetical protein F4859DRAFT_515201 [Xylaria cf. heliscus]|nr:hypothetical protein F4859DRAFT_515201 [Xylaria cf. heliscus]
MVGDSVSRHETKGQEDSVGETACRHRQRQRRGHKHEHWHQTRETRAQEGKTGQGKSGQDFKERAATGGPHHARAADALRWVLSPALFLFLVLFLVMLPAAADKTWGGPSNDGIGDGGSKSALRSSGGSVAADADAVVDADADADADGADGRACFVIRSEAKRNGAERSTRRR